MKLYRFELLFFDGTVITGKFCVGVPLKHPIYLSINPVLLSLGATVSCLRSLPPTPDMIYKCLFSLLWKRRLNVCLH